MTYIVGTMGNSDEPDDFQIWFDQQVRDQLNNGASIKEPSAEERLREAERRKRAEDLRRRIASGNAPSPSRYQETAQVLDFKAPKRQRRGTRFVPVAAGLATIVALVLYSRAKTPEPTPSGEPIATSAATGTMPATGAAAPTSASAPSTSVQLAKRSYDVGDCITWDQTGTDTGSETIGLNSGRTTSTVDCATPHLMQVAGRITAPGNSMESAMPQLDAAIQTQCPPLVEALLGRPLDPTGRFNLQTIIPTTESWAQGDRDVWCGVGGHGTTDAATGAQQETPIDVDARGATQSLPVVLGTCGSRTTSSVPCTSPHSWEITGSFELDPSVVPPAANDTAAWDQLAGSRCQLITNAYLGRPTPASATAGWLTFNPKSYAAGDRTIRCIVMGNGGGPLTGPIRTQG